MPDPALPTRIREMPEEERPREKLAQQGAHSLSDSELIAILLRTGMKGVNAVEIARRLLARHGSIAGLARCSVTELAREKGIGPTKAIQLAAAFNLGIRLAREGVQRREVTSPQQVYDLLAGEMRALHRESLRLILLDTKLNLIRVEEISLGTINESHAHPREVFRPAIAYSAYAVILAHNHPSGDPSPSRSDREVTTRMAEAARIIGIKLYDHLIIGAPRGELPPYFSFREAGLLEGQ